MLGNRLVQLLTLVGVCIVAVELVFLFFPSFQEAFPRNCTRYLVTGGGGFIGSHLVERLLSNASNCVIIIDNFYTGSRRNLAHLANHPRLRVVERDVRDSFWAEVDFVFHLASPAAPIHYQKDPLFTLTTNVEGSRDMKHAA